MEFRSAKLFLLLWTAAGCKGFTRVLEFMQNSSIEVLREPTVGKFGLDLCAMLGAKWNSARLSCFCCFGLLLAARVSLESWNSCRTPRSKSCANRQWENSDSICARCSVPNGIPLG